MDLRGIVQNPVFIFATGALGGVFGTLLKGLVDVRTSEAKRRQDAVTHFFAEVEKLAPSYYLMSNHASVLSGQLDRYLQVKRELQMTLMEPDQSAYDLLSQLAENTAAEALFEAGSLYRVIIDRFFLEGGDYVVPDQWANKALNGLHNKIMDLLVFDDKVLLKHIDAKTERPDFFTKLYSPATDPAYEDLRQQYALYKDWVTKQDKDVKLLAVNARAYSDLFTLEMKRLYEDVWNKTPHDPLQAREVQGLHPVTDPIRSLKRRLAKAMSGRPSPGQGVPAPSGLSDSTRELIRKAAEESNRLAKRTVAAQHADASTAGSAAYLSLGWSYYDARQWDLAVEEFNKAIARCPSSAAAHNSLANAYTNKADFVGAAREYSLASHLDPGNPIFKHNHGKMLRQRGQQEQQSASQADKAQAASSFREAAALFEEAIALGAAADRPDDRQQALRHNDLGGAFSDLKQWDDAIAAYGDAIVLQPLQPILYGNLAQTYQSKYDDLLQSGPLSPPDAVALEAAIGEYRMAVSVSTGDDSARYERSLAAIYQKAARWAESANTYRQALAHFSTESKGEIVETHYQIGRMYQNQEDWGSAANAYAQALEIGDYKNSLHAASLVIALHRSGNAVPPDLYSKSIAACHAAIQAEPAVLAHRTDLARIYFEVEDYPRFLDERDRIVRLAQGNVGEQEMAGYDNQLGLAYRRLGIWEMAFDYYHKAIQQDDIPEYQRNMGLALQALGRHDEARIPLEKARRDGLGEDLDFQLSLAEVYAYGSTPDLQASIDLCGAAAAKNPTNLAANFFLGELLIGHGSIVEGAAQYRKAVGIATSDGKQRGEWMLKGTKVCDWALQADPNCIELQYGRAQMLFQLGDAANAESGYRTALGLAAELHLESISIQNALAQLLYSRQDFLGAEAAWKEALATAEKLSDEERKMLSNAPLGPIDLGQIVNNLGTAHDALGEKDDALHCYQEAVKQSPLNFVGHFNLARIYYRKKEFDQALSQFQESLRLIATDSPARQKAVLCIGNCFFRLNRGDLAQEKWEEVADSGAGHPDAHYNLGVWFWTNGLEDEAATRWENALKVSPTLLDAEYNLGVLSLKRGKAADALGRWKTVLGKPGFESLAQTVQDVEEGETPTLEIRDILEI